MANFVLLYTQKQLKLRNQITELKKLGFNVKQFEDRLSTLDTNFKKVVNDNGVQLEEAEFNILSFVLALEAEINKAYNYYAMCQTSRVIDTSLDEKENQTINQLQAYAKNLLSIISTLETTNHMNLEYLYSTQLLVHTILYKLIKVEYRLYGRSNTLNKFRQECHNEEYLIYLMNQDEQEFKSKKFGNSILKYNTVNPNGTLNEKSIFELSINDDLFKNDIINQLKDLDRQIEELKTSMVQTEAKGNELANAKKYINKNKRRNIKRVIKNSWIPTLFTLSLLNAAVFPWISDNSKKYFITNEYLTEKVIYDELNGMSTIKEYDTLSSNQARIKVYNEDGTVETYIIDDIKETNPKKLIDMDLSNMESNKETVTANTIQVEEPYKSIEIVKDINVDDCISEFDEFGFIFTRVFLNSIIALIALIILQMSNIKDNYSHSILSIKELISSIKDELINNSKLRLSNKEYYELNVKLAEVEKLYNELYNKYILLSPSFKENNLTVKKERNI